MSARVKTTVAGGGGREDSHDLEDPFDDRALCFQSVSYITRKV
jgi:hypothetical protein